MKIIDAHIHYSKIQSFLETAHSISHLDYSKKGLENEYKRSNVICGIAMGVTEQSTGAFPDDVSQNPMGVDLDSQLPRNFYYCLGINPVKLQQADREQQIQNIEKALQRKQVVGLKIYAGYYPYYVYDKIYGPIYELAAQYQVPVVIHTGDTYAERGLLKYAHPLHVDELAVYNREVTFIIAHFGDPWIMDAGEIILKNPNVYADLSGLIIGDEHQVERMSSERLFVDHIQRGLVYADNYSKVLFGTDWPLVKVEPYIEFVKKLVPEVHYEEVFFKNALKVFRKIDGN